jgi:uncharacterized protein YuzE
MEAMGAGENPELNGHVLLKTSKKRKSMGFSVLNGSSKRKSSDYFCEIC